jgi:hypothetical protein
MALSIFLVCFLLAATYFQAIQGLTSAVIMAVLTALCVGLAFGTYEAVAAATLISVTPDYAHAIAFFGMFLIPLIICGSRSILWCRGPICCRTCSTGQPRAWWVSSPRF